MPRGSSRSLKELIQAGKLKAGDELEINSQKFGLQAARLRADGGIEFRGRVYDTPTGAAKEALDVGSVDGWLRWRVPRLKNRHLGDIRDNG